LRAAGRGDRAPVRPAGLSLRTVGLQLRAPRPAGRPPRRLRGLCREDARSRLGSRLRAPEGASIGGRRDRRGAGDPGRVERRLGNRRRRRGPSRRAGGARGDPGRPAGRPGDRGPSRPPRPRPGEHEPARLPDHLDGPGLRARRPGSRASRHAAGRERADRPRPGRGAASGRRANPPPSRPFRADPRSPPERGGPSERNRGRIPAMTSPSPSATLPAPPTLHPSPSPRESLLASYRAVRGLTLELVRDLAPEAWRIQSMPDVSPPWWNLGHTSWFFARNVLAAWDREAEEDGRLEFVLNSYYESLGPRIDRARRGSLTRPGNDEVRAYRASVDARMEALFGALPEESWERFAFLVRTGIEHEQQHQELLLTEVKHILATNPPELRAPYAPRVAPRSATPEPARWADFEGGLFEFGNLEGGWCWDNELPVHRAWLDGFALADRLVTVAEYSEFVADGGYAQPLL